MHADGYTPLIEIDSAGKICDTDDGTRVFYTRRDESCDFNLHAEGYPISREALEYCCEWGVEEIHIHEMVVGNVYVFQLDTYLNARQEPFFGDEYLIPPLQRSSKVTGKNAD
jgi:hypothetical protein